MRVEASSREPSPPAHPHRGPLVELSPPPYAIPYERFAELHDMTADAVMQGCRQDNKFPYIEMRNPLNPGAKAKLYINMVEWNRTLQAAFLALPQQGRWGFLKWIGIDHEKRPDLLLVESSFDGKKPWSDVLSLSAFAAQQGMTRGAVAKMCDAGKVPYIEMRNPLKPNADATRWIYMPAWNAAVQLAYEEQSRHRPRTFFSWFGIAV